MKTTSSRAAWGRKQWHTMLCNEERIKVMAVYRDADLQQYNPSCPASRKGLDNDHKIDIADRSAGRSVTRNCLLTFTE